jgi:P27 family predicted phage terminase small subunit
LVKVHRRIESAEFVSPASLDQNTAGKMTKGMQPVPAAVAKLRGTWRADRHAHGVTLEASRIPDAPDEMTEREKKHWQSMRERLEAAGLAAAIDLEAFTALVEAFAAWETATRELRGKPLLIEDRHGVPRANPLISVCESRFNTLKWCLTQFGMTPSSRTGIRAVEKTAAPDPMAALCVG